MFGPYLEMVGPLHGMRSVRSAHLVFRYFGRGDVRLCSLGFQGLLSPVLGNSIPGCYTRFCGETLFSEYCNRDCVIWLFAFEGVGVVGWGWACRGRVGVEVFR